MSPSCTATEPSAYASGRFAREDDRLFRPGGLELTARAIAFAGLGAGATVLDLGCGSGASVRYLRTLEINAIGIDCDRSLGGSESHGLPPDAHVVADAKSLPFPPCSVAGVLAECSLSVSGNQELVLAECARVLADGGKLILSDLYARQYDAIGVVRALKGSCVSGMIVRENLEADLALNDFTVDLWEDHSQALRDCAARFILERGSLDGLWQCSGEDSAETIQSAMRAARAGYFLMIATRNRRDSAERWMDQ